MKRAKRETQLVLRLDVWDDPSDPAPIDSIETRIVPPSWCLDDMGGVLSQAAKTLLKSIIARGTNWPKRDDDEMPDL